VTIHNVVIEPATKEIGDKGDDKAPGVLVMNALAKTYRYLDEGSEK
jgi:hypothetical protein